MLCFFKKRSEPIQTEQKQVNSDFTDISLVASYFKNETGITFDKQVGILQNKVTIFCKQRDIYSFEKLVTLLQKDKNLKQELIDYLTTNETYFYREFKQIKTLVKLVKEEQDNMQILCAPSATGEEPYSIAIALLEAGISATKFHVTGIDINKEAIVKAQNAVYGERNIKYLPTEAVDKYFIKEANKYILTEDIKRQVSFQLINIFDKKFLELGKFDFVFSRNMLIYFDKETKQKAKAILESMRKDNKYDVFFGHADLF